MSDCQRGVAGSLRQGLQLLLQDILSDTLPKKPDDLALGAQRWAVGDFTPYAVGAFPTYKLPRGAVVAPSGVVRMEAEAGNVGVSEEKAPW